MSSVVKIYLALDKGPIQTAIRQVLPVVGNSAIISYVDEIRDADLIVFADMRSVEKHYDKTKTYAYLRIHPGRNDPYLPENCTGIDPDKIVLSLIDMIGKVKQKLELGHVEKVSVAAPTKAPVCYKPDALRILVIDDILENIASAMAGLGCHRLTTATGYREAMDILSREKFDVVLTDLHLPMSSETMGDKFRLGELVPYGILLMIEAARQGAKKVAVVTDLSHHDDPFSAAFDHYSRYPVTIEGARVTMMHAPMKDGAKDWATALILIS